MAAESCENCGKNRLLFITANTGSLFEETTNLEPGWVKEILQEVKLWQPAFFALHMQEIGGKNYKQCMRFVQRFIQDLQKVFAQEGYFDGKVYLDEELQAENRFTALGSAYFCHRSFVKRVSLFDFSRNTFKPLNGFEVHSLTEGENSTVQRKRFPNALFAEVKGSRKGFMRCRWRFDDCVMDLVNIHLFHDACNLMAVEQSPSVYCGHRKQALAFVLNELGRDNNTTMPMFIFGDFNFRLDAQGLIESLAPLSDRWPVRDGNSVITLEFRRPNSSQCILRIGTKTFEHENHDTYALDYSNLLQFDKELDLTAPQLREWPITFPPSYPYCEDVGSPNLYMRTRAPAWCDRVLMNDAAWKLVQLYGDSVTYNAIGQTTCMGDHKPVSLTFFLSTTSHRANGDASGVLRFIPLALWRPCDWIGRLDWIGFDTSLDAQLERLTFDAALGQSIPLFGMKLEAKEVVSNCMAPVGSKSRTKDMDEFISMVTLNDNQTTTVMDASSYGFGLNERWTETLDRLDQSIESDTDQEDQCRSTDLDVAIRCRVEPSRSTSTTLTTVSLEGNVTLLKISSGPPSPHLVSPPNSIQFLPNRLFDASMDEDLVRRRSIKCQYPYMDELGESMDIGQCNGATGKNPTPKRPPRLHDSKRRNETSTLGMSKNSEAVALPKMEKCVQTDSDKIESTFGSRSNQKIDLSRLPLEEEWEVLRRCIGNLENQSTMGDKQKLLIKFGVSDQSNERKRKVGRRKQRIGCSCF